MRTPYPLNSEEGSAYTLGYNDCQFGVNKHSNPWGDKIGVIENAFNLYEAYKRGYQDCAEVNFGDRLA